MAAAATTTTAAQSGARAGPDAGIAAAREAALVEQAQLLVAEMLAENALAASGGGGGARPSTHSAEVKSFHALFKLQRLMEELTAPVADDAPREVQQAHRDRIRLVQPTVEKGLREILLGQLAGLCLSPSFYRLLGRIFRMLMERGDSRNIMAITNDLHDHLGPKATLSAQSKTAIFYCLGEISRCKQGRMLAGHLRETTQIVARVFKSSAASSTRPADNEYRFAAVRALSSALQGSETAGRPNHADALKILIRAAADKAPPVRAAVADAALALALVSDGFASVGLDQLVALAKRGLEDRVAHVRSSYAKSLGAILCLAVEMAGPLRALEQSESVAASSASPASGSGPATSTAPKGVAAAARLAGLAIGTAGASGSPTSAGAVGSPSGLAGQGAAAASPRSAKLRGFAFAANFGGLGTRAKPEAPTSYSLDTVLDTLMAVFDAWAPDQLERRADMAAAQSASEISQRSTEVRMAVAEAAVEFFRYLQRAGDAEQQHQVISAALAFVRSVCNDKSKIALESSSARARDDTLRRAVAVFVLSRALSAKLSESGKIELARQLLAASTAQAGSLGRSARDGSPGSFKRRNSRTMASLSLTAQTEEFRHGPLFISACLSEAAALLSSLGDASRALHRELDFQALLPLLEHSDAAVRLECSNVLYVCAITQPGYASRGILPLLQLVGLYQPELAMTLASGPPHNASPTELKTFDAEADRTLEAIEGLVRALCVFVYSSSANGRPRSASAEAFLQRENMLLPAAAHFVRHEVPNSSTALLSGDLKGIPENTSMALLGHAKSMIARQHDGSTRPAATARIASSGWALVASLVTLGSAWCTDNLGQLFQAWQSSVDASVPALEAVAKAKSPLNLRADAVIKAALTCLQAALQAMASFVRCNQPLLRDMPAVTRAVIILVEQVVQASRRGVRELPFADVFMGVHAALFDICIWTPRAELRVFKETVVVPLQSLSMAYFLGPAGLPEGAAPSLALSTLLSSRSGLLKFGDDVLDTAGLAAASSARGDGDAGEPLGRKQWRFEEAASTSPARELLMGARVLSSQEAYASAAAYMMGLSCNASHAAVAVMPRMGKDHAAPGAPGAVKFSVEAADLVDGIPVCGMVRIPAVKTAQNCIDAAVTFSAVVLTNLFDDADRANVVQYLFGMLKRRAGDAQNIVLHNGVTALLAFLKTLTMLQAEVDPKQAPWVARVRSIFCVAIASPHSLVRRACATGLALLTRLAGPAVGHAAVQALLRKLEGGPGAAGADGPIAASNGAPVSAAASSGNGAGPRAQQRAGSAPASPHMRAGVALALALIRREAPMHDTRFVKNNTVYDMCKITAQPVRTSALHAWQVIVESAGIDVGKFVGPSLALINAHLLAVDGHHERGGFGASRIMMGTMTCLARLANSLIEGLGPELARPDIDAIRFFNVWEALRLCSADPILQVELVRMVQQILLFHPALIIDHDCDRERVQNFLQNLIIDAEGECVPAVRMSALHALSLLTERMVGGEDPRADVARAALSLLAFELVFRDSICQDWIIPPASSLGYGAILLSRSSRPNQATEPLFIQAANAAFRDVAGPKATMDVLRHAPSQNPASEGPGDAYAESYERFGFDQAGQTRGGLPPVDPYALCDVSAARRLALRNMLKFVGLSHMKMRPADKKAATWTPEDIQGAAALTDWMRFFRAVMTGTTDALGKSRGAAEGAEPGLDDEAEDSDSDNEDADDAGPGHRAGGDHPGGGASEAAGASGRGHAEPAGPILDFCDRVLSKCSWETKALAVEGLLEVLAIAKAYPFHCDLDQASRVIKKAGLEARGQFICMHIRELLTGASQAANGTIQSAEVPQLSIQGYCALVEIVRMFANSRDRHQPDESVLKQYEMQLTATLGPGLGRSASPLVLPFVGVLAVQLLVSGVSTSPRRIVGLLLPSQIAHTDDEADEDDDDDDDEDADVGGALEDQVDLDQMPSFVQAELLILRLVPLARLWLFAQGCDTISEQAVQSTQVPKALRAKPSKKKGIRASIEKALLDYMSGSKDLVDAWLGVLRDVAKLAVPIDADKEHEADAFDLVDASDAIAVFPAYLNAAWVVGRALGTLAEVLPKRAVDQGLVLRTALILGARARPMDWPSLALGTILQTIAVALPVSNADPRCEALAIMTSTRILEDESTFKIGNGDFIVRQAFHVVSELLHVRARRVSESGDREQEEKGDAGDDPDLASWHKLVEAVLLPAQTVLGAELVAASAQMGSGSAGKPQPPRQSMAGPRSALFATVTDRALALFPTLAKALPAACAETYVRSLAWNALATAKHSTNSVLVDPALLACSQLFPRVPSLKSSLLKWAQDAATAALDAGLASGDAAKAREATRELGAALSCVLSRQALYALDEASFRKFAESTLPLLDPEQSGPVAIVLALAAIRRACVGDNADPTAVRHFAGTVGVHIARLCKLPDGEAVDVDDVVAGQAGAGDERLAAQTVPGAATLTLADLATNVPDLAQFAILSALSLAEGPSGSERCRSTRDAGRAALVHLASKRADEVRALVQTLSPGASGALQNAIKMYLAEAAA